MKCIFLDFDGVINNWYHFDGVSIENAMILKKIIELSDAKIIATTSNKYSLQRTDKVEYYKSKFYNDYVKCLNELGYTQEDFIKVGSPLLSDSMFVKEKNTKNGSGVLLRRQWNQRLERGFHQAQGGVRVEKDLSHLVKKYSQKNSTEKPPVQSLPGAAF